MYESLDQRYNQTWEISGSGDGLITVKRPRIDDSQPSLPKPVEMRLERDIIEKLVNIYFTHIAHLLPVVTQQEFLSSPGGAPPSILLYSICLIAAGRREVPQTVFDTVRHAVNTLIKSEDILSRASIVNVQSLLIMCMMADCHSQFVPNALSALWIRLGSCIRMASPFSFYFSSLIRHRLKIWGCIEQSRSSKMLSSAEDFGVLVSSVIAGTLPALLYLETIWR
jgi:hypothetical protein